MSHRLQVLIPPRLDARVTREAQRNRMSKGEWVRRVLEEAVERRSSDDRNPLKRLAAMGAPTADIDWMLEEIQAGRS